MRSSRQVRQLGMAARQKDDYEEMLSRSIGQSVNDESRGRDFEAMNYAGQMKRI